MNRSRIVGLIATIALLAWVALAAGATQYSFSGSCSLHGTSTFDPPYLKAQPDTVGYHFKTTKPPAGTTNQNTCTGDLNGAGTSKAYPVVAYVDGKGQLSCASSTADGGTGAVTIADGAKSYTFPATLSIKGAGTEVELNITQPKGGGQAYGHASFAKYSDPNPTTGTTAQCNTNGVHSIEFDADFASTAAFTADKPAPPPPSTDTPTQTPPPSGDNPGTQPPPSQGTTPAPTHKKAKPKCSKKKHSKHSKLKHCKKTKKKKK